MLQRAFPMVISRAIIGTSGNLSRPQQRLRRSRKRNGQENKRKKLPRKRLERILFSVHINVCIIYIRVYIAYTCVYQLCMCAYIGNEGEKADVADGVPQPSVSADSWIRALRRLPSQLPISPGSVAAGK